MANATRPQQLAAYSLGVAGLGSNALVYFLVPLRALDMGISLAVIGLLLATKSLVEAGLSLPLGTLINRVGARATYLIGSAGFGFAGLGFAFANSTADLFVLQVALGVFRPLIWVGGQSYASAMGTPDERSFHIGRFSFAANVGQIIGPLIAGAAVQALGPQRAFLVLTTYGVVFALLSLVVPDVGRSPSDSEIGRSSSRNAVSLLKMTDMQVVLVLTFTRLWLPSVWVAFLPLFLVTSGTSVSVAATATSGMALVATVTTLFTARVAKLASPASITSAALGVSCLGVALTPLASAMPAVYLPATLVGIGQGLSLPLLLLLVSSAAPEGQRNLALSLRMGVSQAAATAAPLLLAPIIAVGGLGVGFVAASGTGALLLIGAVALARRA